MYTKEKWIFIESNLSVVANGNNIAFTGIPRHVSEIRNEGESWLDMRNRTEPERKAVEEEQKANARLIAAAPDMLEALQNLENDDNSIPERAWKMVKDAIAKAICEYSETENEERENNI